MSHTSSKNPQIQKLLEKCHELLAYKEIVLCWIPSHIGIQGNEMVDKQAKTSLSLEPTSFEIPFSNFKPSINKYILDQWQTPWNNSIGNKLLEIKPIIGEHQPVDRNIRKEVLQNLIAIFKILFCFTFESDHNKDSLMLYSVQLKNMYSYLNSSLKLSDIVRGLSCQQSYFNSISLYKLIIIFHFIYYKCLLFPSTSCY